MIKKFFKKLMSLPGDYPAFIGFGIFVSTLSVILFIVSSRVSINTEKRASEIQKIVEDEFKGDTLINFDVKDFGYQHSYDNTNSGKIYMH